MSEMEAFNEIANANYATIFKQDFIDDMRLAMKKGLVSIELKLNELGILHIYYKMADGRGSVYSISIDDEFNSAEALEAVAKAVKERYAHKLKKETQC